MRVAKANALTFSFLRWLHVEADAFFTLGTLQPAVEESGGDDARLLKEVEACLDGKTIGARFNKDIEERFDASAKAPRAAFFIRLAIVGTIIYNLFLILDALMIPDVIGAAALLQFGLATPIAVTCIALIRFTNFDTNYATLITVTAMTGCTIAIFLMSRSPHVHLFACVFCLFVLAVNVAQAWAFRWAASCTALTNVAVWIAIFKHPSLDVASQIFAVTLLSSASYYSLVGNYRIDAGLRRAYLFVLKESLRANLLTKSNGLLQSLATIDGLTGIGNRRFFDETLNRRWAEHQNGGEIALLLFDIDHFKRFNDMLGHPAGDACLRQVAERLTALTTRPDQILARYGGEEFVLILENTGLDEAYVLAEHIRRSIERLTIYINDVTPRQSVTISIGCAATSPSSAASAADLLSAADAALYLAKRAGRNRTQRADVRSVETIAAPSSSVADDAHPSWVRSGSSS